MVSSRPPLAREEILARYADVVDEHYLAEEEGRRELFEWVLGLLGGYFVRGNRLLEIGSNLGLFLDTARRFGWAARGVEPSRWAVETGRKRFGVDLDQKALEQLDEPAGSADAVVLLDVLEHVVDPLDALRRLRLLLDEEGVLVLSTVNIAGVHARVRRERWPWLIRPHLHYFTPATLQAILRDAGFRMIEWSLVPRSFHLSYVATRARTNLGVLGRASARLSKLVDPKLPVGWLGDVVLVVARPARVATDARTQPSPVEAARTSDDGPVTSLPAPGRADEAPVDVEED